MRDSSNRENCSSRELLVDTKMAAGWNDAPIRFRVNSNAGGAGDSRQIDIQAVTESDTYSIASTARTFYNRYMNEMSGVGDQDPAGTADSGPAASAVPTPATLPGQTTPGMDRGICQIAKTATICAMRPGTHCQQPADSP